MFSLTVCLFIFISTFLVFVFSQNSNSIPSSPCPDVFRYQQDGTGVYGTFRITPPYTSNLTVKVNMDIPGVLSASDNGKIVFLNNNDAWTKMSNGEDLLYRVNFPNTPNIPRITAINYNNRQICSGPRVQTRPLLSVQLSHFFYINFRVVGGDQGSNNLPPNQNNNFYANNDFAPSNYPQQNVPNNSEPEFQNYPSWQQQNFNGRVPSTTTEYITNPTTTTSRPTWTTRPRTTSRWMTQRPRTTTTRRPTQRMPVSDYGSDICGIPKKVTNELVYRGDTTSKGDWPWLAALFLNELGALSFSCGGTLISRNLVLTAGHCLVQRNYSPIQENKFIIMLGLFNIQDWIVEQPVRSLVNEIIFHPAFEAGINLKNDIALMRLSTAVSFNDYILPVCLWTANYNLLSINGNFGSIVGWGRDENGLMTTPEPRVTKQRIVTTDQCRDSDPAFRSLVSDTTICAGNRNGTGPCNGDSGGGMFFSINGRWVLRGVVSTALRRPEAPNSCNTMDYVVYTDVSKFMQWITEKMN